MLRISVPCGFNTAYSPSLFSFRALLRYRLNFSAYSARVSGGRSSWHEELRYKLSSFLSYYYVSIAWFPPLLRHIIRVGMPLNLWDTSISCLFSSARTQEQFAFLNVLYYNDGRAK